MRRAETREAVTEYFEANPEARVTVQALSDLIGSKQITVYRTLRMMVNEGVLDFKLAPGLSPAGRMTKTYLYFTTPAFVVRPYKGSVAIVDSALASRGALMEAWWPIKWAANDEGWRAA